MGWSNSVYNANYGVREESNSNGKVYYDRNGDHHYGLSDAILANERILKEESFHKIKEDEDFSQPKKKLSSPSQPVVKKVSPAASKLSKDLQVLLEKTQEFYDFVTLFVNEVAFSKNDFLEGAKFFNFSISEAVVLELKKYDFLDFKELEEWTAILSADAGALATKVCEYGASAAEESYQILQSFKKGEIPHIQENSMILNY